MKQYVNLKTIIDHIVCDEGPEKDIFAIKQWAEQDEVAKDLPKLLVDILSIKIRKNDEIRYYQDCWTGVACFQCNRDKVSREDELKMNAWIDRFMGGLLTEKNIQGIKETMERIDINDVIGCNISFREYLLKNHGIKFKNDTISFNDRVNTYIPEQNCDKEKETCK